MDVTNLRYLDGYRLFLEFSDGTHGVADLAQTIKESRSAVRKLTDPMIFRLVKLEDGTATWPSGIDIAAERLYSLAHNMPPPATFEAAEANELAVSLQELRRLSEVRQEELAAQLDVTQGAISRLESGGADAKLATLRRYASALGWELQVVAVRGDKRLRLRGI